LITSLRTALVCLLYAAVGFALYRARAVSDSAIFDSELVVFAVPAGIAFLWILRVLTNQRVGVSFFGASLLAGGLVIVSFLAYLGLGVNLYGS
jgi:hypothetical protein